MRSGRVVPAGLVLALVLPGCSRPREADEDVVRVAVASSFLEAHAELSRSFEALTGWRVVASSGSTGALYAQVLNGAPFHLFLAADEERPRRLEEQGRARRGRRLTYARGRLALYGPALDSVRDGGSDLVQGRFTRLAIANPATAPYGAAAQDVLRRLGVADRVAPRTARGESVAQVLHFVRSGAAELGFVALAQVRHEPARRLWVVPADLHRPILHDGLLLEAGEAHPGALAYFEFLRGPQARRVLLEHGYADPSPGGSP